MKSDQTLMPDPYGRIYVDNNATTPVAPEVLEAMLPYLQQHYGNASSVHSPGRQAARAIEEARQQVAALVGARPAELVFTSGGTESNYLAIRGALAACPEKNHVITCRTEHSAVLSLCKVLQTEGYQVTLLDVNPQGQIHLDQLRAAMTDQTALVSIMAANNETGVLHPVREIGEIVHAGGGLFHTDAVQAIGKIPISLKDLPVDFLSLSGHKIYAPKGIGALFIRRGIKFCPPMTGGGQEKGRRGGTENTASIVGFALACRLAMAHSGEEAARIRHLRDRFEQGVLQLIPTIRINGVEVSRLPGTSNISFLGVEGESILLALDERGICVSAGSACSSRSVEPSHVLMAMGLTELEARGAIRFSFGRYNSDEDVEILLKVLPAVVESLRSMGGQK